MANNPKTSAGPKAFDIFSPNRRRPQPSSRPILVSNKPEQEDPMMTKKPQVLVTQPAPEIPSEAETPTDTSAPAELLLESGIDTDATISPGSEAPPDVTKAQTSEESSSTTDTGMGIPESAEISDVPGEESIAPEPDIQTKQPSEAEPVHDAMQEEATQAGSTVPKAGTGKSTDEDLRWTSAQVRSAATQAPIISIHKTSHNGKKALKWILEVLVGIVILSAVIDVVLDAGWWTPSFSVPHTHFIKKS